MVSEIIFLRRFRYSFVFVCRVFGENGLPQRMKHTTAHGWVISDGSVKPSPVDKKSQREKPTQKKEARKEKRENNKAEKEGCYRSTRF